MARQRTKQRFVRKAVQYTKRFFQMAALGAALTLAVGCGRTAPLNAQDGGPNPDARPDGRPDVVQMDSPRPKPDALKSDILPPDLVKPDACIPLALTTGNLPPLAGSKNAKFKVIIFDSYEGKPRSLMYTQMLKLRQDLSSQAKAVLFHRDFVLGTSAVHSKDVALAVRCANEQSKFLAMYDKVSSNQSYWEPLTKPNLLLMLGGYAVALGLKIQQFNNCLVTAKYNSDVSADWSEGVKNSVISTPTTFIVFPKGAPADTTQLSNVFSKYPKSIKELWTCNYQVIRIEGVLLFPGLETNEVIKKVIESSK